MTSKIIVNNIESDVGISSVTFNDTISGNLEGNINSSGTSTFNVISGVSTIGVTTVHVNGINDISYPTIGPLSHRNIVSMVRCKISQRGTSNSFKPQVVTKRSIDLITEFQMLGLGQSVKAIDAPAGFSNSLKYECTTAKLR